MHDELPTGAEMLVVECRPATRCRVEKHLQPHLRDEFPAVSFVVDVNQHMGHIAGKRQHWRVKRFHHPLQEFLLCPTPTGGFFDAKLQRGELPRL
jgi:hypothetical protein